jgi:hypothetical protein
VTVARVRRSMRAIGDLKGLLLEKTGMIMVQSAKVKETTVNIPTIAATIVCKCHKKSRRPQRKKRRASWSNPGRMASTSGSFHRWRPSKRYCRNPTASWGGDIEVHRMYALIQPLRRMPNRAAAKLRTRLRNQSVFTRMADAGASYDDNATCGRVSTDAFES